MWWCGSLFLESGISHCWVPILWIFLLQLFKTPKIGWGVRTLVDVPAGAFVCTYAGAILTDSQAEECGKAVRYFFIDIINLCLPLIIIDFFVFSFDSLFSFLCAFSLTFSLYVLLNRFAFLSFFSSEIYFKIIVGYYLCLNFLRVSYS